MRQHHSHHRVRRVYMDDPFEDSKIARVCVTIACKIPVLIVLAIVFGDCYLAFGYSRIVLQEKIGIFCTFLLLLLFFSAVTVLLISYFRCMLTSSAVKDNPPPAGLDTTDIPRCEKCKELKPPRAHHCSLCHTCTLKMDHHCPWVGNCVGLTNYKFFLIFLLWVSIAGTLYGIVTGIAMFIDYNAFGSIVGVWTVLTLFISVSFALSVGGFFCFHVHLLSDNRTTLENMRLNRQQSNPYNIKTNEENFSDVFGDNKWLWFLPTVKLKETGYESTDQVYNEYLSGKHGPNIENDENDIDDENEQRRPFITTNVNMNDSQAKIMIESPSESIISQHVKTPTPSGVSVGGGIAGDNMNMNMNINNNIIKTEGGRPRIHGLQNMKIEIVDDEKIYGKKSAIASTGGNKTVSKRIYEKVRGDSLSRDDQYRNMDN